MPASTLFICPEELIANASLVFGGKTILKSEISIVSEEPEVITKTAKGVPVIVASVVEYAEALPTFVKLGVTE